MSGLADISGNDVAAADLDDLVRVAAMVQNEIDLRSGAPIEKDGQPGATVPSVCPSCCRDVIASGLADEGDLCPACADSLFGTCVDLYQGGRTDGTRRRAEKHPLETLQGVARQRGKDGGR